MSIGFIKFKMFATMLTHHISIKRDSPSFVRRGRKNYSSSITAMLRSARALGSAGAGHPDISSLAF